MGRSENDDLNPVQSADRHDLVAMIEIANDHAETYVVGHEQVKVLERLCCLPGRVRCLSYRPVVRFATLTAPI